MALAGAEAQRNAEPDPEKRKYPGGAFDPVGLSKDGKARRSQGLTLILTLTQQRCAGG